MWKEHTTNQNIVWFYVSVHHANLFEQAQCQKKLMGIRSNCSNIETNIFTKSLYNIAQVHANEDEGLILERV